MTISLEERIYGLSLIWREAKYNFANWDEIPELDWDRAYQEALPRVIAEENPYLYYRELQKFVTLLRDGHSWVSLPNELNPKWDEDYSPIATSYIEGKHVLMEVPEDCGVPLYSEIVSINNIPLQEYLEKHIFPYQWHEKPDSIFRHGLLSYTIYQQEKGSVTIGMENGCFTYIHGEKTKTVAGNWASSLMGDAIKSLNVVFESDAVNLETTIDNIGSIYVPDFRHDDLKEKLYANIDVIKNCAGFIIDMRWNSGGNSDNACALAQLFIDDSFREEVSDSPLYIANYGAYGQYRALDKLDLSKPWDKKVYDIKTHQSFNRESAEKQFDDCPVYLNQPVVILAGSDTASAAEHFLSVMKMNTKAVIVGTPSYGSNGQPYFGQLPGSGRYAICTHKCYDTEGNNYWNTGIKPDIFAENTIQSHIDKFDAVFDKGLSILRETIKRDLMSGLSE